MRLAAAGLLLALAGCGGDPETSPRGLRLAGCEMNVDEFPVPLAGVRRAVPAGYRLSRYVGTDMTALDTWVLDCRGVRIDGENRGRAVLSLVAAVVRDPAQRLGPREPLAPNEYHHYLLLAHTTNARLAERLKRAGLPTDLTDGIRRARAGGVVTTEAPGYTVRMDTRTVLDEAHSHDNSWWRDTSDGRAVRLRLRARDVNDHACAQPPCSRITAAASSPLARLLGARSRTSRAAFDHLPLDAELELERRQPNGVRGRF